VKKVILLILVFNWFGYSSQAQNFHLKNFRVENGMASSQVFDIDQDQNGNIYIATDLGLTKYDGYSFGTYSEKDGLGDNAISKIFIDDTGNVWCLGKNRTFSVFNSDSAFVWSMSDSINKTIDQDFIRSFAIAPQSESMTIGISQPCFDNSYLLSINNNGEITKTEKSKGYYFLQKNSIFGGYACPGSPSALEFEGHNEKITSAFDASRGTILSVCASDNQAFVVSDNQIVAIDKSQSFLLGVTHSGSSIIDSEGNLWVSTYSGVLFFKNGNLTQKPIRFLENISITKIFEDLDGSIWIGTSSKGLYFIKNPYTIVVDKLNNIIEPDINALTGNENTLAFSDSRNNLYVAAFDSEIKSIGAASSSIQEVDFINKRPLFFESQKRNKIDQTFFSNAISADFGDASKITWVGKINGFKGYRENNEKFNSSTLDFTERVNAIKEDSAGIVWIGTPDGLFVFDSKTISLVSSTKGWRIDAIDFYKGNPVIGSRGNGIAFLENESLSVFNETQGLISNFINDIFVYENELWCATNSGISKISNTDTILISRKNGLPSSEINVVWANKNKVFFGTKKGLVIFDKNYFDQNRRLLKTAIVEVKLGETKLNINQSIPELPFEKNGISILLKAIDFRIANPIQYRYRLSNEKQWIYTDQPNITYASLPTGEWTFYCSAQNEKGEWGPINDSLKLVVLTPYYLQWWFIVIILAITGLLIWGIMQWRYSQNAKEERTQNELNVLKIKALSSQMNPHFIFNSLNSIQTFIVDNDLRMSNKYLTKFARLMRLTLNNSNETFVPLKDVLTSLELYMELEQLRFGDKFDFEIKKSANLEIDSTKVPSMLLQPFLENAILHGILPKQSKGHVSLTLERKDSSTLIATILDNGVGREFHKNKIGKKHKSHGLRITRERLQVFESLMGNKFNLQIHDLKDEEGKPKGTEIKLTLPSR